MSQDKEIAQFFQDPDASSAVVMAANQIAAPFVQGVALGATLLCVDAPGPEGVAPFIYYRF